MDLCDLLSNMSVSDPSPKANGPTVRPEWIASLRAFSLSPLVADQWCNNDKAILAASLPETFDAVKTLFGPIQAAMKRLQAQDRLVMDRKSWLPRLTVEILELDAASVEFSTVNMLLLFAAGMLGSVVVTHAIGTRLNTLAGAHVWDDVGTESCPYRARVPKRSATV